MITEWQVRLTYPTELLDQPLLYGLIRQFDLQANILQARVTRQQGWLILALRGEGEAIRQGLDWMAKQGVAVEVLVRNEEETCAS